LFPTLFSDAFSLLAGAADFSLLAGAADFSLLAGAALSLAAAYDYYAGVGGLSPVMPRAYLAAFYKVASCLLLCFSIILYCTGFFSPKQSLIFVSSDLPGN